MLSDRFGGPEEAVAYSSIKLARHMAEPELSMDLLVAAAVLEFADDLRAATEAAIEWTRSRVEPARTLAGDAIGSLSER